MMTTRHRACCAVEALEDRNLMAVAVQLVDRGSTLRLTGDTAAEWISIHQDDALNTLSVQWGIINPAVDAVPPPVQQFTSSTIKRIVVNTRGGNDTVTYAVDGLNYSFAKSINIDTGAGNDTVMIDMGGQLYVPLSIDGGDSVDGMMPEPPYNWPTPTPLEIQTNLNVSVQAGAGNDSVDAIFGHVLKGLSYRAVGGTGNDSLSTSLAGVVSAGRTVIISQDGGVGNDHLAFNQDANSIEAGARLSVVQRGGAGNDQIDLQSFGLIQGTLLVNQVGNTGNDKLSTIVNASWPSTGVVRVRAQGETSNDQMVVGIKRNTDIPPFVVMEGPLAEMRVEASAHGGMGRNLAWVTPNVKVYNATVMESSWNVGSILPVDPWPF
jgi:hypothetical protein